MSAHSIANGPTPKVIGKASTQAILGVPFGKRIEVPQKPAGAQRLSAVQQVAKYFGHTDVSRALSPQSRVFAEA